MTKGWVYNPSTIGAYLLDSNQKSSHVMFARVGGRQSSLHITSILFRILYRFGSVTKNFGSRSYLPCHYGSWSDLPGHDLNPGQTNVSDPDPQHCLSGSGIKCSGYIINLLFQCPFFSLVGVEGLDRPHLPKRLAWCKPSRCQAVVDFELLPSVCRYNVISSLRLLTLPHAIWR